MKIASPFVAVLVHGNFLPKVMSEGRGGLILAGAVSAVLVVFITDINES